jgi:hypothetical protein
MASLRVSELQICILEQIVHVPKFKRYTVKDEFRKTQKRATDRHYRTRWLLNCHGGRGNDRNAFNK